jgi:hypothetical protein
MILELVVGDWSHDGHNQTETYSIECNLGKKALESAYAKGAKIAFDLKEHCCDYEDSQLPTELWNKLIALGFDNEPETGLEEAVYIEPDVYLDIYMFIAKLGNPKLDWSMATDSRICIGGYGLFGN